jgi:hypothetical protein
LIASPRAFKFDWNQPVVPCDSNAIADLLDDRLADKAQIKLSAWL